MRLQHYQFKKLLEIQKKCTKGMRKCDRKYKKESIVEAANISLGQTKK